MECTGDHPHNEPSTSSAAHTEEGDLTRHAITASEKVHSARHRHEITASEKVHSTRHAITASEKVHSTRYAITALSVT